MHRLLLVASACCTISGCVVSDSPVDESLVALSAEPIQLNLLFVHGVQNDAGGKARAHNSLNDLRAAIAGDMPSLIASYQASHPGVAISFAAASANLYTAQPSGR